MIFNVDHNVFWLDVQMKQAFAMHVLQRLENLFGDIEDCFLVKDWLLLLHEADEVCEVGAVVGESEVAEVLVFIVAQQPDDIRVARELLEHFRFFADLLDGRVAILELACIRRLLERDSLDCHRVTKGVFRLEERTRAGLVCQVSVYLLDFRKVQHAILYLLANFCDAYKVR